MHVIRLMAVIALAQASLSTFGLTSSMAFMNTFAVPYALLLNFK